MSFLPQEIIRKKRDRLTLNDDDIRRFAFGIADGSVTDGQVAAFAMAVLFNGMTLDERISLTLAMRDSGDVLDWSDLDLPGPVLDKHSTGGVGDTVSLVLGPMIAACGGFVPMISGRRLGHTGGTLDKFESIPGYDSRPTNKVFRETVRSVGVAIIGQTNRLAPADRRFYAIRDVTATVESIDLITASILAKKLAAGLDALVMDVKSGNGAFMPTPESSRQLAECIARVANGAGTRTSSLLTDMNQPLAPSAGNAVEVQVAIDYLTGKDRPERLDQVVRALGSELLILGRLASTVEQAEDKLGRALSSGQAAEIFGRMVAALGGPADLIENPEKHLPQARIVRPVYPETDGFVTGMNTREIGLIVLRLGGARPDTVVTIDHSVGLSRIARIGDAVGPDRPIAFIHASSDAAAADAATAFRAAVAIGHDQVPESAVIMDRITGAQP